MSSPKNVVYFISLCPLLPAYSGVNELVVDCFYFDFSILGSCSDLMKVNSPKPCFNMFL